eukprot:Gb_31341 [translate_table: standard]
MFFLQFCEVVLDLSCQGFWILAILGIMLCLKLRCLSERVEAIGFHKNPRFSTSFPWEKAALEEPQSHVRAKPAALRTKVRAAPVARRSKQRGAHLADAED